MQRSAIVDSFAQRHGKRSTLNQMVAPRVFRRQMQAHVEENENPLGRDHPRSAAQMAPHGAPYTSVVLFCMWCLIGLVAAYDTYLLVKLHESIQHFEKNPLGLLLLELDGGSVALFVACKMIGTSIVLGVIPIIYLCKQSWGLAIASALTAVQLALLMVLTLT